MSANRDKNSMRTNLPKKYYRVWAFIGGRAGISDGTRTTTLCFPS
jgi:hypothetical protein